MKRLLASLFLLAAIAGTITTVQAAEPPPNFVAGPLIELNDNGAWSWFMDERVVVDRGKLIVGSVRAVGTFASGKGDPDWGNVEVSVLDLASAAAAAPAKRTVLHRHYEQDDHDAPAFLVLPDGRYLAVYTKHGVDHQILSRFSAPGDPLTWGPPSSFTAPGADGPGSRAHTVTYSNLFRMPDGRILNLFRGYGHDPNLMVSTDDGRTWTYSGRLLHGRGGYSPYLKYAHDGKGTIVFAATDDHPRNFDNSIHSGFLKDGAIHLADGTPRARLNGSTDASLAAWDLTPVFKGDPDNVAWVIDLELDREGRPRLAFSVQKDGRGLPRGKGGMDHRFDYARWDGAAWQVHEMAHAGTRLYPGEDDYTGLVALDPNHPDVATIATDADPVTGAPLISAADQRRHHELFRGTTPDNGKTWRWEPITANSTVDNLRPIIPRWNDPRTALVWMRGTYRNNHGEWTTAVVATILGPTSEK